MDMDSQRMLKSGSLAAIGRRILRPVPDPASDPKLVPVLAGSQVIKSADPTPSPSYITTLQRLPSTDEEAERLENKLRHRAALQSGKLPSPPLSDLQAAEDSTTNPTLLASKEHRPLPNHPQIESNGVGADAAHVGAESSPVAVDETEYNSTFSTGSSRAGVQVSTSSSNAGDSHPPDDTRPPLFPTPTTHGLLSLIDSSPNMTNRQRGIRLAELYLSRDTFDGEPWSHIIQRDVSSSRASSHRDMFHRLHEKLRTLPTNQESPCYPSMLQDLDLCLPRRLSRRGHGALGRSRELRILGRRYQKACIRNNMVIHRMG